MSGPGFPLNPVLAEVGEYPFLRLAAAKRRVAARGVEIIDFGVGDPREATAPFIREALAAGIRETMEYPKAVGMPELRAAIADWIARRFGVRLDPDREVVPTLGSKEAVFSLAQVVVDPPSGRDLVITTEPGYPVPARGARFAGGRAMALPLHESNGFLPDIDAVSAADWARTAIVWVNYPNNPTGAVAPLAFYERLTELAATHGFLIASDEAYSELGLDDANPVPSALQVRDRSRVCVINTLSKRSSMTGYRSGFVAGPPALIDAHRVFRPTVGTAPQEFVQRAAVAAWGDEAHVREAVARYRAKRELLVPVLEARGLRVAASDAAMYLWLRVPEGTMSEAFATDLLERAGLVLAPGSFLGPSGEGYVRMALVPTIEQCRRAAALLEDLP